VLAFAGVIGLGTLGVLPLVLDRVQAGRPDAPKGMPWKPSETAARPAQAQQISAVARVSEQPPSQVEQTAQRSLTVVEPVQTTDDGGSAKSAYAQQPETVRTEPPAAPPPVVSAEKELRFEPEARVPAASIPGETLSPSVKQPKTRAERRPQAAKKLASGTAEKRAKEARRAVRRFDDNLRDIPLSAYSGDGSRRTIVIHPTSIQDYYYYSTRR
jgi:hypothetical protein